MRRDSWITLALILFSVGYSSLTFTRTLDLRDEGYLLGRSLEVADGAVPHRDFSDVYGPGVFALSAVALNLGEGRILDVRLLVALFKALAVAASFWLARRFPYFGQTCALPRPRGRHTRACLRPRVQARS